jgi:hypothetical protein
MLCTLCGKNMPALAERLYFPELSIPGLSGCDVHGPTVAIYRMEIHPGMKCEDLGTNDRASSCPTGHKPGTTISIAGQHRAVGLPMRRGARTWDWQRFISSSLGF